MQLARMSVRYLEGELPGGFRTSGASGRVGRSGFLLMRRFKEQESRGFTIRVVVVAISTLAIGHGFSVVRAVPASAGPPGNFLGNGEVLWAGQSLNAGGGFVLTMQHDGILFAGERAEVVVLSPCAASDRARRQSCNSHEHVQHERNR